jgi:hypothetical protein
MASPSSNLDSILITVDDEASVDDSTTEEFGSDIFFEDQENNHLDTGGVGIPAADQEFLFGKIAEA